MRKYGEGKTTRIMMATVRHVTSSSGLRKFQADGFLFDGVYHIVALSGFVIFHLWPIPYSLHSLLGDKSVIIVLFNDAFIYWDPVACVLLTGD